MGFNETITPMMPAIESELQRVVDQLDIARISAFKEMITYHMGWTGESAGPEAQGKRIRPMLLLLCCSASGGDWTAALPAAASVELIHNFSLVHDDIQDGSDLRRGRATVWKKWGPAHAINAGDALLILAHLVCTDLTGKFPGEKVIQTIQVINQACLELSSGQFMDMSYERCEKISMEDYWPMVSGKTAALLSACCRVGSILGGAGDAAQTAYRDFGHYLGLAFQAQDDYLGIWGDSALTGKSTDSDLLTRKKSLPVLYGLEKQGAFARRWAEGTPISPGEVGHLAELLSEDGAKLRTQETADQMTDLALQALRTADPQDEAGEALFELPHRLLDRQS